MRSYDDPSDLGEELLFDSDQGSSADGEGAGYGGGGYTGGINRKAFELLRHSGVALTPSLYSELGRKAPPSRVKTMSLDSAGIGGTPELLGGQPAQSVKKLVDLDDQAYRMTATNPGDFPEIVAVGDDDGYWATGISIDEGFVLTAGHVHALGGRERIFGKPKLDRDDICRTTKSWNRPRKGEYAVKRSTRHPGFWNDPFFTHDLALLKLKSKGRHFPPTVGKIATAEEFDKATVGLLVGYGARDGRGLEGYGVRRHGLIPILHEWMIARERWFHRVWGYDSEYEFIATAPLKKADACVGDSGAGFYIPVCPECSREEVADCCRSIPGLFELRTVKDERIKKWLCKHPACSIRRPNGEEGEVQPPEVTWKLAGMVSRQFGLGGDRCGAGSIYVKLYGFRQKTTQSSLHPLQGPVTSGTCDSLEALHAEGAKRRGSSDRDSGANYYGRCITAMMAYLDGERKEKDLEKLRQGCRPCGVRGGGDECDDHEES